MNCSLCGTALAENTKFCKQCGTLQPRSSTAPQAVAKPVALDKACSQCHAANKPQAKFCLQCGHTFSLSSSPLAPDRVEVAQRTSSAPALEEWIKPAQVAPASEAAPDFLSAQEIATPAAGGYANSTTNAHYFPSEPPATAPWRKWALAGIAVLALGLTAWMALKPLTTSPLASGAAGNGSAAPAAAPPSDQERAELLVGPQGNSPSVTPTPSTSSEATDTTAVVTPAPTPVAAPPVAAVTTPVAASQVERPAALPIAPPKAPARQPAQKSPSLDDLLD